MFRAYARERPVNRGEGRRQRRTRSQRFEARLDFLTAQRRRAGVWRTASPRGASLAVPRLPPVQARQIPVRQRALATGCRGEYIIHRAIGAGVDATEEMGAAKGEQGQTAKTERRDENGED